MPNFVPSVTFDPTGVVVPDESAILAGYLDAILDAFGVRATGDRALETPQGQLASSLSMITGAVYNNLALLQNNVDPQYSSGRWQDAISRLYLLDRKPATPTTATVRLSGKTGLTVPAGTQLRDGQGNTYRTLDAADIGTIGYADVQVAASVDGPVALGAGGISGAPYQQIPGLDSATNLAAGSVGTYEENRDDFEYRRRNSVALNARNILAAVRARVFNVPDVTDVCSVQNVESEVVEYGSTNYPLQPHSIYVAVSGGEGAAIAQQIFDTIGPGCNFNGNTEYTIYDSENQPPPYPQYVIRFERPADVAMSFQVELEQNDQLPSDIVTRVRAAVLAAFIGADGGQRARIGSTVYATRYISAIQRIDDSVNVLSLTVNGSSRVTVGIDQRPTLDAGDINVSLSA